MRVAASLEKVRSVLEQVNPPRKLRFHARIGASADPH
jgi:hypothetical protein